MEQSTQKKKSWTVSNRVCLNDKSGWEIKMNLAFWIGYYIEALINFIKSILGYVIGIGLGFVIAKIVIATA
jgi:hypothetical protein